MNVETILKLNEQLMNLPAVVVVTLFAIAVGYVLKVSAVFPNNRIPLVIVLFTAAVFPVLEACADVTNGKADWALKIPINVVLGFILGFVAWTFHAQILKRFVDPKFFNDDGSTKFLSRDQVPPTDPPAAP